MPSGNVVTMEKGAFFRPMKRCHHHRAVQAGTTPTACVCQGSARQAFSKVSRAWPAKAQGGLNQTVRPESCSTVATRWAEKWMTPLPLSVRGCAFLPSSSQNMSVSGPGDLDPPQALLKAHGQKRQNRVTKRVPKTTTVDLTWIKVRGASLPKTNPSQPNCPKMTPTTNCQCNPVSNLSKSAVQQANSMETLQISSKLNLRPSATESHCHGL